ncbi:hypothetical protein AK88_05088 [Plasmodium fragile]|uniref:U3 small nucleolar RNA-associated protein 14 n=1 Tax=Plasmodium fragile TaxID=5857 RepID=A0A0D9QEP6_PLAFR|nr:uncharacterized protein AK88_05088 [Plasmodium fragile]KJP85277.1 hypothetical protein AK88_05088 [Plasmodium fragile]
MEDHLEDASTTLNGGLAEMRVKKKKNKAKKMGGGDLKKKRHKDGLAKKSAAIKMARLIEKGKIPSLKGTIKKKMSQVKGASVNNASGDDDDCGGDSRRALKKRKRKEKRKGKKLAKGKQGKKKKGQTEEEDPTDDEPDEAPDEEEDADGLELFQGEDVILEEDKQMKTKGMGKKSDPSANLITFLRKYNYQEEGFLKRKKYRGQDNEEVEGYGFPPEDAEAESYQYMSQKGDVYKIEKPLERVDLADFIYTDGVCAEQIGEDINMLKRGTVEKGKALRHMSVLEEQKINEHLAYVNNVDIINKMNKSFYVINNAQGVHFGQGGKNGPLQVNSEEFLNKSLLRRRGGVAEGKDEVGRGEGDRDERSEGRGAVGNREDSLTALQFEAEMQKNLRMSKMLIVSDDVLKTEREKKRDELKKIAQLKALLLKEEKKNKYKKRIKSKSYRRHLRMKEKKEEEKIFAKIHSEDPDLAQNLALYEKEYAQKRNLINNVNKRKTVRLLNRYKNEELKKQMLRSFQAEKEEKNVLRRIIERAVVEEEDGGGTGTDEEEASSIGQAGRSMGEEGRNPDDQINTSSGLTKKNKVRKELQKRNLERFSFVRNAEERKRDEELYEQRKRLLDKMQRRKDDKDLMTNTSSDEGSGVEGGRLDLGLSHEVRRSSAKEASKARAQLARDADLVNALRKGGILGTEEGQLGANSTEESALGVDLLENSSGLVPRINPTGENASIGGENTLGENPPEEDTPIAGDLRDVNAIDAIDAIDDGSVLQNLGEDLSVYNFENGVYEDYVNLNADAGNGDIPREDDELFQLSEDERVTTERVSEREWCNYETLLELEKNKIMKEKEIIEKKKKIPVHTISVFNRKDRKFEKYFIDKVPYPYDKQDYEKTLNISLNKEVNDISAHAKLVAPRLSNRVGNIVSPLVRNPFEIARILTLKRGKNRSKL